MSKCRQTTASALRSRMGIENVRRSSCLNHLSMLWRSALTVIPSPRLVGMAVSGSGTSPPVNTSGRSPYERIRLGYYDFFLTVKALCGLDRMVLHGFLQPRHNLSDLRRLAS